MTYYDFQTLIVAVVIVAHGPCGCSTKPDKCPNMKSLAAIVAALLVTVGAASAGEMHALTFWRRGCPEDATDHDAVGEHVVIVRAPLAGWCGSRGAFEDDMVMALCRSAIRKAGH